MGYHGQPLLLTLLSLVYLSPYLFSFNVHASPVPLGRVTINNTTGQAAVFDDNQQQIIQGPADDGAGVGYAFPAIGWIIYALTFGVPLAFAGIRGWRLTTGASLALAVAVCAWAAVSNSVNASPPISDLFISIIVWGSSGLGFLFGLFEIGRVAGIVSLAISGGISFGIRIVLMREGLLFQGSSLYLVNWVIVGFLGIAAGLSMIYKQRIGILFGSASSGTFLIALGADLIVNQQKGMSRGLRVLMDRNTSHIVDIIEHPYAPPMSTRIIIAASLGLSLILAWAQHKYFKDPFSRKTPEYEDEENPMQFEPTQTRLPRDKTRSFFQAQKSRFSHF